MAEAQVPEPMDMVSISDLEVFVRVARTGNMSAAGRAMRLSPAVVSKRVSVLEARLGVRLFRRTTRQLSPTEIGEGFLLRAVRILGLAGEACGFVERARGTPRGIVRVACASSIYRFCLLAHLEAFARQHPHIVLEIDVLEDDIGASGDGCDLVLRVGRTAAPGAGVHRLRSLELVLCASRAYLRRAGEPASPGDLASHECLPARAGGEWHLYRGEERVVVPLKSRFRSGSADFAHAALLQGIGIAFLPRLEVQKALDEGSILHILKDWRGDPSLSIEAAHPAERQHSAKLEAVLRFLKQQISPAGSLADLRPRSAAA